MREGKFLEVSLKKNLSLKKKKEGGKIRQIVGGGVTPKLALIPYKKET